MKEKNNSQRVKKIRKLFIRKHLQKENLSSPIITNEDLLSKHQSQCSSLLSSPESSKFIPGSMLEFLLTIEEIHSPLFI
ncbi:unnamed protein product (macronuclear) [Paramecium tetraurelia]|uniref:Uncharacterized protein n=1 Tax=Paramecium tetraurelia TaxID=5888 RepID=A0DFP0_PARTE|nr:uncharacterized protein GSPATT00016670001 [Paramecium tetraurelia]CAK81857.1 unnamed protein product [Paramecium tetraurelia]|eukprot:XP_001449254.1 hypothetical protein (macronuclear) [Paramecium tetraurelia strain d4-2]